MLLDTSGLFCWHHRDEAQSDDAQTLFEAAGPKLTHSFVLAEFVALTHARGLPRPETLNFLAALLDHPEVEVVWVGPALYAEAIRLLEARLDKSYSLCDAVSFVLMRQRGFQDALTTDRHSKQEGFRPLLKWRTGSLPPPLLLRRLTLGEFPFFQKNPRPLSHPPYKLATGPVPRIA
jgi:uncharacterized protein